MKIYSRAEFSKLPAGTVYRAGHEALCAETCKPHAFSTVSHEFYNSPYCGICGCLAKAGVHSELAEMGMMPQVYIGLPKVLLDESWERFRESLPQIIEAMGKLAFSLESIREWQRKRKRGRHGRVNRTLPRNYRARSKR